MTKQPITEKDGVRTAWMERAKDMTLEKLPDFLKELTEKYEHDYGTICHAIAAAAVAAAWAVERTPQGGITGFQAGAVAWEILKGWGGLTIGETGARLQNMDNLLFPQYADHFKAIDRKTWERVQKKAEQNLQDTDNVAESVRVHWESVAAGVVPFGLRVVD